MKTIKIQVIRLDGDQEKVLYRNTVEISDSLEFPYSTVEQTLRLLYPFAQMVQFSVF